MPTGDPPPFFNAFSTGQLYHAWVSDHTEAVQVPIHQPINYFTTHQAAWSTSPPLTSTQQAAYSWQAQAIKTIEKQREVAEQNPDNLRAIDLEG